MGREGGRSKKWTVRAARPVQIPGENAIKTGGLGAKRIEEEY
jgi:hypothetical protein